MASAKQPKPAWGTRVQALVQDSRNSISRDNAHVVARRKYEASVKHLESYVFWKGSGRAYRNLWAHQVGALELAAAYLAADRQLPREGNVPEASLIKMPTGTGKSGVIAIIARCLPHVRRVLVLTPRTALADQLQRDVSFRFWQHMKCPAKNNSTYAATAAAIGADLEGAQISKMLPSECEDLLNALKSSDRFIAIGTFQALEQTRRDGIKHGKKSPERQLLDAMGTFDLVIVDEGHYEPAPAWSRAVRDLNLPAILLSATPYRNDYKSFRVRGRFVFNYPFGEAQKDKTIREAHFECGRVNTPLPNLSDADRFVALLGEVWPSIRTNALQYTPNPKLIVRADDFAKLVQLQGLIETTLGRQALLIHEQVQGVDSPKRRFHSIHLARKHASSDKIQFWLHQSKLLEGIDDSSFVAVGIYDRFDNARQMVQQVGRALRTTDASRKTLQKAWIIAVPEQHALLQDSWNKFLAFERYAAKDPQRLVQAEGALPDRLLELMPEVQYLNGEFRPCFAADAPQKAEEYRIPASASVFEVENSFDLAAAATEIKEALLAEDRFKPQMIEGLPAGAIGFVYYAWRSSPFLNLQFFPEWTLGVCIAVKEGNFLFVNDTDGVVLDPIELKMRRAERSILARLMPESTSAQPVRVVRMGTFSLDMSEQAIRSMAIRTRSLSDTFGDLLDPVLVPTTTFGFVGRRGRYLGVTRGRVSDSYPAPVPLLDYCRWARERVAELANASGSTNRVFDRYARIRDRLTQDQATPRSILLDFDDTFADFSGVDQDDPAATMNDLEYNDLCSDVGVDGKFSVTLATRVYPCHVKFNEATQRYKIVSEALDKAVSIKSVELGKTDTPVTTLINREQSFRIIVPEPHVIYAHRKFFEANTSHVRPDNSVPLLERVYRVSALDHMVSEKGEKFFSKKATWKRDSVFGLMKAICDAASVGEVSGADSLFPELRAFDTIVCDDDGQEIGDFLAIDSAHKRVALIHAKVGKSSAGMSVGALQEVGRQVLASLAFCSAVAREAKIKPGRWGTKVNANGIELNLSRQFRNERQLTVSEMEEAAASALADRSWNREIWIVCGKLLNREKVERSIRASDSNRTQQFLMFFDSLVTGCARANSTLRVYCN